MRYDLRKRREFVNPNKRTTRYKNSFFPYCISEWEILGEDIKSLPSVSQFKNKLLLFICPLKNSSFGITDIHWIKLLTKLRVEFSDLHYHRFQHNFNCRDTRCSCLLEDESNSHFFLRCPHHLPLRKSFLGIISTIIGSGITVLPCDHLTDILLYGNAYNDVTNKLILKETIEYIRKSKRFDVIVAFYVLVSGMSSISVKAKSWRSKIATPPPFLRSLFLAAAV